jgi:hypothetical protein
MSATCYGILSIDGVGSTKVKYFNCTLFHVEHFPFFRFEKHSLSLNGGKFQTMAVNSKIKKFKIKKFEIINCH